jgi:hypothetical protein
MGKDTILGPVLHVLAPHLLWQLILEVVRDALLGFGAGIWRSSTTRAPARQQPREHTQSSGHPSLVVIVCCQPPELIA